MKEYLISILLFFSLPLFLAAQDMTFEGPKIGSQAAVLMDADTGALLYVKNGDNAIPPASLAKLMTIHIALNEVTLGRASLDDVVNLPSQAWAVRQPPRSSLMYLAPGHIVTLRELLLGLAIPSGNDAAIAVALHFAPTVDQFAARMNQEAQRFGLLATHFVEPSGFSEDNITTAREFAFFCREYLRLHPETLRDYHSVREFAYPKANNIAAVYRGNPGTIIRYNSNNLLGAFEGVDGLKTGYIDESGFNIAITAKREDTRFILVILGAGSIRIRDEDGMKLLAWGFEHFKTLRPVIDDLPPVRIWKGKENYGEIIPGEALAFTTYADRGEHLYWNMEMADPIIASLPAGTPVGTLIFYDDVGELHRFPLITKNEIEQGGFFKRLWDSIGLFFRSLMAK